MKKGILTVLCLIFCIMTATSCKREVNTKRFVTGNLKFAQDMHISKMSDYEKDGVKIYETYADNHVFSFIVDFSKIKEVVGGPYFKDKNGEFKYNHCRPLEYHRYFYAFPNYQSGDKIILERENGNMEIDIEDFFPGITATEEVRYTSSSSFTYNDKAYKVTDVIKTNGYYIVTFDKTGADPKELHPTIFNHKLDKQSSYFVNDYKMYITDFLNTENCFYFKFEDNVNLFPIELTKVS